jgi:hypothetical protein
MASWLPRAWLDCLQATKRALKYSGMTVQNIFFLKSYFSFYLSLSIFSSSSLLMLKRLSLIKDTVSLKIYHQNLN